jgi:hypothetical protein
MRPSLTALTPSSALLALQNLAATQELSALQRQKMRTIAVNLELSGPSKCQVVKIQDTLV